MNNLTIKNYKGINVTDSREVAEMIRKNHAHLCRDIQGYIKNIGQNPKLDSDKFFIESTWIPHSIDARNRTNHDDILSSRQKCTRCRNSKFVYLVVYLQFFFNIFSRSWNVCFWLIIVIVAYIILNGIMWEKTFEFLI